MSHEEESNHSSCNLEGPGAVPGWDSKIFKKVLDFSKKTRYLAFYTELNIKLRRFKMAKLHELLAVESSVTGNFNRDIQETVKVFGKAEMFQRFVTKKEHFNDEDSKLNTTETKEITTTVKKRLDWFKKSVSDYFDLVLQKDKTNQKAVGDIVVDGVTVAKEVPATTILMLESKLQELRKVFEAAPTLPTGTKWEFDANEGIWNTVEPVVSFSTKRITKPVVLYEATKEHPAQVKEVSEDVPVAKITKLTSVGMLTSLEKATILGRLDDLLQACKKARQQANMVTVEQAKMGDEIFKYLYQDIVK
jgi:hypothetical protein